MPATMDTTGEIDEPNSANEFLGETAQRNDMSRSDTVASGRSGHGGKRCPLICARRHGRA
jgi:hypothetical protein